VFLRLCSRTDTRRGVYALCNGVASVCGTRAGAAMQEFWEHTVQEKLSCLGMGCDTLEEREGIAHAVGYMSGKVRRREHGINGYDFLEESGHDA
jgi:hypothetical protein